MNALNVASQGWINNQPFTQSAAASYFAVFSLPGLLIIVMSVTTFFLDEEIVRTGIYNDVGKFLGSEVTDSIQTIADQARVRGDGYLTLLIGGCILLFGASSLFNQLKKSFNAVWSVQVRHGATLFSTLVNRLVAMSMAIMIGFLLVISMYMSAAFKVIGNMIAEEFPDLGFVVGLETAASFLTIGFLFTLMFKVLPDVYIRTKIAFVSGLLCSLLFMLGALIFAEILARFAPQSVFGAAGSIVLLMIWVNFTCMILQFGAQLVRALMLLSGANIKTTRFFEIK